MFIRLCRGFTWSFCECVFVLKCTSVRVVVYTYTDIAAWSEVCMSTISDSARVGCLSMCALLSVQSSLRQQGAPFQFTHQPQRQGVKERGITVGDFTFAGRDYQSGDPCVEVMREGDCRGTVWGSWNCLGDSGVVRGGRAAQLNTTLESVGFSEEHSCQAAHLFDTRRCGMAVRGCLSTSPHSVVCSKALDN